MTDYISAANFKTRFGITVTTDDTRIAAHVSAASLQVDSYCGRQFGPGTASTRYFRPDSYCLARIDDCHTITEVAMVCTTLNPACRARTPKERLSRKPTTANGTPRRTPRRNAVRASSPLPAVTAAV